MCNLHKRRSTQRNPATTTGPTAANGSARVNQNEQIDDHGARDLTIEAFRRGSMDNITVMVIMLDKDA